MRQVTEAEFFAAIGVRDCHPRIINSVYPYASVFYTPQDEDLGRIVPKGDALAHVDEYFLNDGGGK